MTLPSFTRRAFLVPVIVLATLVGFSQANEASAQSLQGTWEFTWFDASTGDTIGNVTFNVDRKAKSFKKTIYAGNSFLYTALKVNPSKNTFEVRIAEGDVIPPVVLGEFEGAGIADLDQGIIIGVGLTNNYVTQTSIPVVFIGIKQ